MAENHSKKVAIIVCAVPPYSSGIGVNAFEQARHLSRAGLAVTVFTPAYPWLQKIQQTDFELVYLPPWLHFGLAAWLPQITKKLADFSLIHLYYPFYGTAEMVYYFKKRQPQIPLVLHYQMDPVGTGWKKVIFSLHQKIFFERLLRVVDKVVAVSEDHARHSALAAGYQKFPKQFVFIPNGVDTALFAPAKKHQALRQKLGLAENLPTLLFVGGLDPQHHFKGLPQLLLALAKLKNSGLVCQLLVVGGGSLLSNYQQQAAALGLAQQVFFAGNILHSALPDYYCLGDIFVFPSVSSTESFGIVIAEAQACGLPAVVSDLFGVRQTISSGQSGYLVKPGQVEDLAEHLKFLLTQPEQREKFAIAARRYAVSNFSWEQLTKKYWALYQDLWQKF